jgi:hypothetical protein
MINTWNESLLHEELKDYYCGDTGKKEVPLEGSICDVLRDDGVVIEIQTSNLGKLKNKLIKLLKSRQVILVYPIAQNTIIETFNEDGSLKTRRKSPKHGTLYQLFKELTGIWMILGETNLEIQVALVDILEIRIADGSGTWRKKGVRKDDKKMIKLHTISSFMGKSSYAKLIPDTVPEVFTTTDLKIAGAGINAGRMAWVLRKAGIIEKTGKKGNAFLYRRSSNQ